ncbi:hypothetical protein NXS19_010729 [Fusarium pseudograminearum]|uniref:Uncharacterized protein n=1 Tax=Fusarium pseudograminearum (strain CS3096) TaxID=1028729 RepID=K3UXG2_FUSPC|nr:hypothetical protein FPSE_02434 [Fusarium pseudograminearum CS3096]EKJ77356.1 hypothetical protein FPSE_02434 [Fusarium pseudograminearum CS3096]KAF0643980.1 hypothetical protein FPSE5266_02434 [Fusarium pseudograminearum]UZP42913.1 hypothetical protein NXS19_010729 [Fusarium pseudograminearum]
MLAKVFSVVLFLSVATAKLHNNCACHNGDSYNFRMTMNACTVYDDADYQWGGVKYDTPSGRCTQEDAEAQIAGDQWEDACKEVAAKGFPCADGKGTCFANPKEVRGRC